MVVLLNVIILAVCMFVNYKLAQKQGRSVIWALVWGAVLEFSAQ